MVMVQILTANPSIFIKNSKSDKDYVILLMHCAYMSKNSVKALPDIIKYYKDNGYEFKVIDENTPEEFHFMKNLINKIKTISK